MGKVYSETKPSPLVFMNIRQLWQAAIVGLAVGIVMWGIALLLDTYVYKIILCRGDLIGRCAASPEYAAVTASFISAALGLFALAKLQFFRPLLVVITALISLWGVIALSADLPWYGALLAVGLLHAAAYPLFSWVVRIRSFLTTLIVLIILMVIIRVAIGS